ncbi:hypothetical protein [Halorhodospira neutriphila]|uniref:hypothetical protein n=1 Tax=Halorhodospira neutriphila TaxID=168379 RepID=UPI001905E1BD|nr:hypothetical protein [Halorhodospira neutriphila]
MFNKVRAFFRSNFGHFAKEDFWPGKKWIEPTKIFFVWAIPAFFFVLWSSKYASDAQFFQSAVREGIGPNLWNLIGSLGLFVLGLSVIFPGFDSLRGIARNILLNTFAIGSLTFGLLFGRFFVNFPIGGISWWKEGLFGVTSALLFFVVFLYNLAIWYLSYLLGVDNIEKSPFVSKIERCKLPVRFLIGIFVSLLILLIFLSEI